MARMRPEKESVLGSRIVEVFGNARSKTKALTTLIAEARWFVSPVKTSIVNIPLPIVPAYSNPSEANVRASVFF